MYGTRTRHRTDRDVRLDWWHVVAALPLLLIALAGISLAGVESPLLWAVQVFAAVIYLPALVMDVHTVRLKRTDWQPKPWRYVVFGLAVFYTAGLLSLLVTPYYLHKRHNYVGAP